MKILVTGGRDFEDMKMLFNVLDEVHAFDGYIPMPNGISLVIHGDADGADTLAGAWARNRGIQEVKCPANWDFYKKAAGPIRNRAMLGLRPDYVIAFPGGTGTADMKKAARGYKIWEPARGERFADWIKQFYIFDDGW